MQTISPREFLLWLSVFDLEAEDVQKQEYEARSKLDHQAAQMTHEVYLLRRTIECMFGDKDRELRPREEFYVKYLKPEAKTIRTPAQARALREEDDRWARLGIGMHLHRLDVILGRQPTEREQAEFDATMGRTKGC